MSEWQATTLGQVVRATGGDLQTGPFGSQLHARDYVAEGTPLVMPVNIGDNVIREEGIARVSAEDVARLSRHQLRPGDIVFGRRGDIGRRAIIREHESGWLCGTGCLAVKFGKSLQEVSPEYVALYVGSRGPQSWLNENAVGGTMPNLSTGTLGALPVAIPSKRKQDAIVEAADSVMALERDLKRLIAKKRAIKRGMMQELLTGRTRLPGFEGDWEPTLLRSVLKFQPGAAFSSDYFDSTPGGLRLVRNRDLRAEDAVVYYSGPYSSDFVLSNGDVLIGMDGEFEPVIWRGGPALLNQRVGRLNLFGTGDVRFIAWALAGPLSELQGATGATTVKHLSHRDVEHIELLLPLGDEQVAIADALSDADAEIAALERRLEATRAIKQGMMQELLSGRTRLPVGEDAA